MQDEKKIPIIVGVTGHRQYNCMNDEKVLSLIRDELKRVKKMCPNSPLVMLSSLADGADRQCAKIALEEGYSLIAALPMEKGSFKEDFSDGTVQGRKRSSLSSGGHIHSKSLSYAHCDLGRRKAGGRRMRNGGNR